MALESFALVTLEEVKDYLGIDASNTRRDETLENLINETSREILRDTEREFAPAGEDTDEARTVEYDGSYVIDLSPFDVQEVVSVVIDPDGDNPTDVDDEDWRLEPLNAPDGVYQRIRLKSCYSTGAWPSIPVEISGTWGWPEVPADIKGWVKELVEDRFTEDVAMYADADGSITPAEGSGSPFTMPRHIQNGLNGYKRPRIGSV